jgi:hypothetical protein
MLGFGEGATFPTATRAMQNWVARDRRGFAQGFVHLAARLGNAITPPMVAALIGLVTWRGSFVLLGLVSLVWVLVWVWYFRDDPRQHRGVTEAELASLPVQETAEMRPRVPWRRLTLRILPVTITYFCYGWSFWLFITWLPSFFKDHYNLDLKNAALFSSAVFFAGVVGDTSGGMISDAILRRTGDPQAARRNVIVGAMIGRWDLPRPRIHDRQSDVGCPFPGRRVFLPRARHRPDLVDPDGYRATICRDGFRADEYGIRGRSDRIAARLWSDCGSHRKLGLAVRRVDRAPALGLRDGVHDAPRASFR